MGKNLICKGTNLNETDKFGQTALHEAAWRGIVEIVSLLIGAGCGVNLQSVGGLSALHYAARNGHAEIISLLIAAGTDIHLKNEYGETALDLVSLPQVGQIFRPKFKALIEPSLPKSWELQTEIIGDIITSFICG